MSSDWGLGEGEEVGVGEEGEVTFEVEEVLLEFGRGFGRVEVLDVGERGVGNGVIKEAKRVARHEAAVRRERDGRGKQPGDFFEDSFGEGGCRQML